ncbi:DNA replication protein DnaC [Variovorax boronicumulans]|uniref:DNA replication protein DnaC n=1 Tax=Variovorax boronicumulans TaxID=436515 RepID=A0AAW8CWV1_9BURK|nr:ATP-binding protein [Variovorax boronicumulans]MDP9893220.1 DNA replication protein DnaC [Variovorax boronicumulans]MDQ0052433.1 DNA replication protein DnaC [Variovorax boronicumulans]
MVQFPSEAGDPMEPLHCDAHGTYVAVELAGRRWKMCPACAAEAEQRRQAREAEELQREKAARAAADLERRLSVSGLVGRFARATFDAYTAELPAQAAALQACRQFAEAFNADAGGGLWLIGPPGTGKTHLGSAIVSHVIHHHLRTASIHGVHQVMQMLRESFGRKEGSGWSEPETTDELLHRLGTQPLLVLDEIGVSRDSEWQREQLFAIVDERYRLERPTVVISNLTVPELKGVLGERVYDRLREGARVLPMSWPSHRGNGGGR